MRRSSKASSRASKTAVPSVKRGAPVRSGRLAKSVRASVYGTGRKPPRAPQVDDMITFFQHDPDYATFAGPAFYNNQRAKKDSHAGFAAVSILMAVSISARAPL